MSQIKTGVVLLPCPFVTRADTLIRIEDAKGQANDFKFSNEKSAAKAVREIRPDCIYEHNDQPDTVSTYSSADIYLDMGSHLVEKLFDGMDAYFIVDYGKDSYEHMHHIVDGKNNNSLTDEENEDAGILHDTASSMFTHMKTSQSSMNFLVLMSMYAIDNNNSSTFDLLNPHPDQKHVFMPHRPHGMESNTIAQIEVTNLIELMHFYTEGMQILKHVCLSRTSTQHVVLELRVESYYNENPFTIRDSCLRIVQINTNITRLTDVSVQNTKTMETYHQCIQSACTQGTRRWNIPFSDSMLTSLLEDALGGNSVTCYLSGITSDNIESIMVTLRHTHDMQSITNTPVLRKNTLPSCIGELRQAISNCRKKIVDTDKPSSNTIKSLEILLKELARAKALTWPGKRALSRKFRLSRDENIAEHGWTVRLVAENQAAGIPDAFSDEAELAANALSVLPELTAQMDLYANTGHELRRIQSEYEAVFGNEQKLDDKQIKRKKGLEKRLRILKLQEKQYAKQLMSSEDKEKDGKNQEPSAFDKYTSVLEQLALALEKKDKKFGVKSLDPQSDYEVFRSLQIFQTFDALLLSKDAEVDNALFETKLLDDWAGLKETFDEKQGKVKKMDVKGGKVKKVLELKQHVMTLVQSEYEVAKKAMLTEFVRNKLLQKSILDDKLHFLAEYNYKEEILFMFRDYRSYFDELQQSADAKNAIVCEKSIFSTLELFKDHKSMSEQLASLQRIL